MKGQPGQAEGLPDMYDAIADAYDRLDDWIVDNWGEKPRPERAQFLCDLWEAKDGAVKNVLEICCGTGLVLEQLALRGFEVAGLDRSAAMLRRARKRLGADVPLVHSELPHIPVQRRFDAVISPGAALNYMSCEEDLAATFSSVSNVLRPGGSFVFDVLSQRMMEGHGGSTVWAADLGDLAFIWEFDNDPGGAYCDATYTQFLSRGTGEDDTYVRSRELHRLYVLDHEVIEHAAASAGLVDATVYDNYSPAPAHDDTAYETWSFTRA